MGNLADYENLVFWSEEYYTFTPFHQSGSLTHNTQLPVLLEELAKLSVVWVLGLKQSWILFVEII